MSRARRPLTYLAVLVFVLLAWEALTVTGAVGPLLLATPATVATALAGVAADPRGLLGALGVSLAESTTAFAIAAVLGLPVGVLVGRSALLRRAYEPVLTTASALPLIILYPVLAAALGIGSPSKVVLGALYAFFPIAISASRAAAMTDQRLTVAARTLGATPQQIVRSVVLPGGYAPIVAGLRVGLSLALVTVIAGEFIAGSDGLGYQLSTASQGLDTPTLFAFVVVTIAFVVVVNLVFTSATRLIERGLHR